MFHYTKHAQHTLGKVSGYLVNVQGQLAAERRAHVAAGEAPEVPEMLPGGTYRLVCDRCSASIADCHRNCGECGSDYCLVGLALFTTIFCSQNIN